MVVSLFGIHIFQWDGGMFDMYVVFMVLHVVLLRVGWVDYLFGLLEDFCVFRVCVLCILGVYDLFRICAHFYSVEVCVCNCVSNVSV